MPTGVNISKRHSRIFPEDFATSKDDPDRIIQSSTFSRLADVTQVVSAKEGHVYHNRLTHSLKVARVARRIAENIGANNDSDTLDRLGGLDPNVVEAAALAHDIGHPPFGHCGETKLNELILDKLPRKDYPKSDGFEGNAQSFRLITKLIPRHDESRGLNLCYATLNAVLKYPYLRKPDENKYGVYRTEEAIFRKIRSSGNEDRTLEAEIMDCADDIAYAYHDLEDFYKAGRIPFHMLTMPVLLQNNLTEKGIALTAIEKELYFPEFMELLKHLQRKKLVKSEAQLIEGLEFLNLKPITEPYVGTLKQQNIVRNVFAFLTNRAIRNVKLNSEGQFVFDPKIKWEIDILQELTFHYVIQDHTLQSQQNGQRKIIEHLFNEYYTASELNRETLRISVLPRDFFELFDAELEENGKDFSEEELRARVVADVISRMSDEDAIRVYQRLSGNNLGSVFDHIE